MESCCIPSCHLEIWTGSEDTGHHPTGQVYVFEALRYRASMSHSALPTSWGPGVTVICPMQSQGPTGCFGLSSLEIHARCQDAAELKSWLYLLVLPTHVSTALNPSPAKPQPPGTCSASTRATLEPRKATAVKIRKPHTVYTAPGLGRSHGFPDSAPHLCYLEGVSLPDKDLLIMRLMVPAIIR